MESNSHNSHDFKVNHTILTLLAILAFTQEYIGIMTTILLFKLFIGLVAFIIFFLCQFVLLRILDKVLGVDFKQAFQTIQKCPKSMSHYYGLRYLGTAIALSIVVCLAFIL